VCGHYIRSEASEKSLRRKVHFALSSHGQVRLGAVTGRQFEKMEIDVGKKPKALEEPPLQTIPDKPWYSRNLPLGWWRRSRQC
jgi:hypothetical protein